MTSVIMLVGALALGILSIGSPRDAQAGGEFFVNLAVNGDSAGPLALQYDEPFTFSGDFSLGFDSTILGATLGCLWDEDLGDPNTAAFFIATATITGMTFSGQGSFDNFLRTQCRDANLIVSVAYMLPGETPIYESQSNVIPFTLSDEPIVADDAVSGIEDQPLLIAFSDIVANDAPGIVAGAFVEQTTLQLVGNAAHGEVVYPGGPTVTYTPDENYSGTDSFRYQLSSAAGVSEIATVTITVGAVNDPPQFDDASIPVDQTIEATSAAGAAATFVAPTATDPDTEDDVTVTCDRNSGSLFPLGETIVICSATDGEDVVTVDFVISVVDTTAPALTVPSGITAEATSPTGATVSFSVSAVDLVDGVVNPVCRVGGAVVTTPAQFPKGNTTVTCSATDTATNAATGSFTVSVKDTTGPNITWIGGPTPGGIYTTSNLPAAPICEGVDLASEVTQCRVYGYGAVPGRYTLTARARDAEGNSTIGTRSYTVVGPSQPTATVVVPSPSSPPVSPTGIPTRQPARPTSTPALPTVTPVAPTVAPTVSPPSSTRPPRR